MQNIEVKVGVLSATADYRRTKKFTGEEVAYLRTYADALCQDYKGVDYTLYKRPNGKGYFVKEVKWSRWQGDDAFYSLVPVKSDEELCEKYPALANEAGIDVIEDLDKEEAAVG